MLLGLGASASAQDLPPESSGARSSANAGGEDAALSPDDILDQMGAPALDGQEGDAAFGDEIEGSGQFEAGRDIFTSPIQPRQQVDAPVPDGLPGMRVEEVSLQGIMHGAFGTVALFQGKDKEIYAARRDQKFLNGRLAEIRPDKVVFEREMLDEFGKRRPPQIREVPLHTTDSKRKGRGQ
jgi:hypothetical protein